MPLIGTPTNLASLADLRQHFTLVREGDAGGWQADTGGSTPSANTGPGTNNVLAFVHTELSGNTGDINAAENNGIATFKSVQPGTSRKLHLRACLQGNFTDDPSMEGLEVQHRANDADSWAQAGFVYGWPYATTRNAGDTVTHDGGGTYTIDVDGGWVDVEIDIPDSATQVRLHPQYALSANLAFHDIALRSFQWEATVTASDLTPQAANWQVTPQATGVLVQTLTPAASTWAFTVPNVQGLVVKSLVPSSANWRFSVPQLHDPGDVAWQFHLPNINGTVTKKPVEWSFEARYVEPLPPEPDLRNLTQDFRSFLPTSTFLPEVQGNNELFTAVRNILDVTTKNYYAQTLDRVLDILNPRGMSFNIDNLLSIIDNLDYGDRFRTSHVTPQALAHILPRIYELKGTKRGLDLILNLFGISLETFVGWELLQDYRRYGEEGTLFKRFKAQFPGVQVDSIQECDAFMDITSVAGEATNETTNQIEEIVEDFVWTCVDLNISRRGGVPDVVFDLETKAVETTTASARRVLKYDGSFKYDGSYKYAGSVVIPP